MKNITLRVLMVLMLCGCTITAKAQGTVKEAVKLYEQGISGGRQANGYYHVNCPDNNKVGPDVVKWIAKQKGYELKNVQVNTITKFGQDINYIIQFDFAETDIAAASGLMDVYTGMYKALGSPADVPSTPLGMKSNVSGYYLVPVDGTIQHTNSMIWNGNVVDGKADGYGTGALRIVTQASDNSFLFYGTYKDGIPVNVSYCQRHPWMYQGNYIHSTGKIENLDPGFNEGLAPIKIKYSRDDVIRFYNKSMNIAFDQEVLSAEAFKNGKALVKCDVKNYGGSGTMPIYIDYYGRMVGIQESVLQEYEKELTSYLQIVSKKALDLINVNHIGEESKLLNEYINTAGFSINNLRLNDIIANQSLLYSYSQVFDKASIDRISATRALINIFNEIEQTDTDTRLEAEKRAHTYNGSLQILFVNVGDLAYKQALDEKFPALFETFEKCTPTLPTNWSVYKSRVTERTQRNYAEYKKHDDEIYALWQKGVNDWDKATEEAFMKNLREVAPSKLKNFRIDANKSTFPEGWVPKNDSWFFGHPGYSAENGKIVLENGDYFFWRYYGDNIQITGGDPYLPEVSFATMDEILEFVFFEYKRYYEKCL